MKNKTIEQLQEDNEILAETNRNCLAEIENLKAELNDERIKNVEQNKKIINQKLTLEKHESTIARKVSIQGKANDKIESLQMDVVYQAQVIEDTSNTAKIRLDNYNDLLAKFEFLLGERDEQAATILELQSTNDSLRQTLKAIL